MSRSQDPAKMLYKKSVWQERKSKSFHFFCPHCKAERRLPMHPKPDHMKAFVQVAIATAFFMVLTWSWFGFKGAVFFVPFWMVYETVYRTRFRAIASCPNCGFDPYLYLIDVKKARAEVEQYWRKKFADQGIPYPGDPAAISHTDAQGNLEKNKETQPATKNAT